MRVVHLVRSLRLMRSVHLVLLLVFILSLGLFSSGCGFHLRGQYCIAPEFQVLRIMPIGVFDHLQRTLRQQLKLAKIRVTDAPPEVEKASILTILSQGFTERTTAYGPDVQVNRATLVFNMTYQITDENGRMLIPLSVIEVERELAINPNQVLGTDFERKRVRNELYIDATTQLIRQLSVASNANSS